MCGGVRFTYDPAQRTALSEYYSDSQLAGFAARGTVESVFWQPRPLLPVAEADSIRVLPWGNRDTQSPLPATGWIRNESLVAGKWDRWRPQPVVIPALQGVEKQVWFTINRGIAGCLVYHNDVAHIYMLTLDADPAFHALTGHDRMPALIDQVVITPIGAVPYQPELL